MHINTYMYIHTYKPHLCVCSYACVYFLLPFNAQCDRMSLYIPFLYIMSRTSVLDEVADKAR